MKTYQDIKAELEVETAHALDNLYVQLSKLNVGRANPQLIGNVRVLYYETLTPIEQLASITPGAPLQLLVKPYDMGILRDIERALIDAKLAITVNVESNQVRVTFPPMTTERRREMTKLLGTYSEQAKIYIRQVRTRLIKEIKQFITAEDEQKRLLNQFQQQIDEAIHQISKVCAEKEEQILKV